MRYLVVSVEGDYHHYDIIPASSKQVAAAVVLSRRKKITQSSFITKDDVERIYLAMLNKSDEQLISKFRENTK